MKLLLSSKGLINKELKETFISFVGLKKEVTIVTTASQDFKESSKGTINLKSKLQELGFKTNCVDLEFEDPKLLEKSQIVIINGGNPYYLLHQVRKSKSEAILKSIISNETPIWGISAGFMILMRDLKIIDLLTPEMNNIGLKNNECLGLIKEIVIPHYDRFLKEGKILKRDIDKFEIESNSRIIRLGEYQCLNYEGNEFSIIGELSK
jgi:dipeptidase E